MRSASSFSPASTVQTSTRTYSLPFPNTYRRPSLTVTVLLLLKYTFYSSHPRPLCWPYASLATKLIRFYVLSFCAGGPVACHSLSAHYFASDCCYPVFCCASSFPLHSSTLQHYRPIRRSFLSRYLLFLVSFVVI